MAKCFRNMDTGGFTMDVAQFSQLIRKTERSVPAEVRAKILLEQMVSEMQRMLRNYRRLKGSRGYAKRWEEIRKVARNGMRVAKRFNDAGKYGFFENLHSTACSYLGSVEAIG